MKKKPEYRNVKVIIFFLLCSFNTIAQDCMTNVPVRKTVNLNGQWQTVMDWYNLGVSRGIHKDEPRPDNNHFNEYAFQDQMLTVPSYWNSQQPKLEYYEGSMWYKK